MKSSSEAVCYIRKFAATLPREQRELAANNEEMRKALVGRFKKFVERHELLEKLRSNGMLLKFIPESRRDLDLCVAAVSSNGLAMEFVPPLLRRRVLAKSEQYNHRR
jgi:acetylornithine/succinyldiaminopimelate/putrescine aminotransferase